MWHRNIFVLHDVHSQHVNLQEESLPCFFLPYNCQRGQCSSAEDKYDQDKFGVNFLKTKCPVSFPLEDKLVVNEHHRVRKSHDATQKNCHHVVHFIVPRVWFETNFRHQKRYSDGGKKIVGVTFYWEE